MSRTTHRPMPDTYFQLVRRFPLKRIVNDEDLVGALATVDDLLTRELDPGQEAYLGALSALIHAYESEHHSIPDASPAEVLRDLAEANGLTGAAIAQRSGIVASTVSALMSGRRRPTPEQMTALAGLFNVSPVVFLATSETGRRATPRAAVQAVPAQAKSVRRASRSPRVECRQKGRHQKVSAKLREL